MKDETLFSFEANDGKQIYVHRWLPKDDNIKGIVQIAHGMAEHAGRYEHFSKFLTEHGFIVYANDHRGHGKTITTDKEKGFFAKQNGYQIVVNDLQQLTKYIRKQHNDLPLFLLGHSMGSFIVRRYMQISDVPISGVILSGTGGDKKLLGKIGLQIAKLEKKIRGPYARSKLMNRLIFGPYNRKFIPIRTNFDFLTRDENIVDQYIADEYCGFICTTSFYVDLLSLIELIHQKGEFTKAPKQTPVFFIAGDEDPVGNYGKDVQTLYEEYINHGFENVSIKLYENARHEILNEINKDEVYNDVLDWLETILKRIEKAK